MHMSRYFVCVFVLVAIATRNSCHGVALSEEFVGRLNRAANYLREGNIYDKIQDVAMMYIKYFMQVEKMTMRRSTGYVTVPISPEITKNLKVMVFYSIDLEHINGALIDKSYDFHNIIHAFRFVRNNTVVLDEIVRTVNHSYTRHGDVEYSSKLDFFHDIKANENMVTMKDLDHVTNVIRESINQSNLTINDIKEGSVKFDESEELSPEDCSSLAESVRSNNISYSALFYQAAAEKTKRDLALKTTVETQVMKKVVSFYREFGCHCVNQYRAAKIILDKVKKAITEEDGEDVPEDDDNNYNADDDSAFDLCALSEEESCFSHLIQRSIEESKTNSEEWKADGHDEL